MVYVYTLWKNNCDLIDSWLENIKEADGIYVLDVGSADGSYEVFLSKKEEYSNLHVFQEKYSQYKYAHAYNELLDEMPQTGWGVKLESNCRFKNNNWKEIIENSEDTIITVTGNKEDKEYILYIAHPLENSWYKNWTCECPTVKNVEKKFNNSIKIDISDNIHLYDEDFNILTLYKQWYQIEKNDLSCLYYGTNLYNIPAFRDEAIKILKEGIELISDDKYIHEALCLNLATIYLKEGSYEEAISCISSLYNTRREHDIVVRALIGQNNYEEALKVAEKGYTINLTADELLNFPEDSSLYVNGRYESMLAELNAYFGNKKALDYINFLDRTEENLPIIKYVQDNCYNTIIYTIIPEDIKYDLCAIEDWYNSVKEANYVVVLDKYNNLEKPSLEWFDDHPNLAIHSCYSNFFDFSQDITDTENKNHLLMIYTPNFTKLADNELSKIKQDWDNDKGSISYEINGIFVHKCNSSMWTVFDDSVGVKVKETTTQFIEKEAIDYEATLNDLNKEQYFNKIQDFEILDKLALKCYYDLKDYKYAELFGEKACQLNPEDERLQTNLNFYKQKKNKICVYTIAKNEEQFVERWVASMKEADYVVVLDTGSTDNTVQKLKDCGITVVEMNINPWRFDTARNEALKLCPNDTEIFVSTDLDEVFEPGWADALRARWVNGVTLQAWYMYTWSHYKDRTPARQFVYNKIHGKNWAWRYPIHEALYFIETGLDSVEEYQIIKAYDEVKLHHYPDQNKSRSSYLPLLEQRKEEYPEDVNGLIYLAHEYNYRGKYRESIAELENILHNHFDEIDDVTKASCYLFEGDNYLALDDDESALRYYNEGIQAEPTYRECYLAEAKVFLKNDYYNNALDILKEAIEKTYQHYTWLERDSSWREELWDLLSLACYYNGDKKNALAYAIKAYSENPIDERLANNIKSIIDNTTDLELI